MKKQYNQPVVTVESISLESTILAGSAAPGNVMRFSSTISTDDQW
jgi:hypothetical protein